MSDQDTNPSDPPLPGTYHPGEEIPSTSHIPMATVSHVPDGTQVATSITEDRIQPPLPAPPKPRIWPISVTLVISMAVSIVLTVIVMLAIISSNMNANPGTTLSQAMEDSMGSWWVMLALLIPAQGAILAGAVVPALLSPVRFTDRLGLRRGNWPIWGWIAASIAGPFLATLWTILMSQLMTESESLKALAKMFRETAAAGYLIPLVLIVAGVPSIAEEWLFRGYVQTRLLQRISPAWAIGISSIIFAAWHLDPVHVLGVLPLGFWLGWICWRAGSILPGMCIHFVNNALSVIETANGADVLEFSLSWLMLSVLILGLPCLLACLWLAWKIPPQPKTIS